MNSNSLKDRRESYNGIAQNQFLLLSCLMVLISVLPSCKKKPDGSVTVTTKSVSDITVNSAKCGGTVSFTGGFTISDCGVCYGTKSSPTVCDGCTEDHYGVGSFNSTMGNLEAGTKYYVRAYARTSSGIKYGHQENFTTKEDGNWLYYGDNETKTRWGLLNGGTLTWAAMFPSSMLATYSNTKINRIKINAGEKGNYTIRIYKGGTSSPTTLIYSEEYTISSTGINKLKIYPAISLTTSQNLWITVTNKHDAGQHPAGTSKGTCTANARWRCINGTWTNDISNGWPDECWTIQVCLSDGTGKDGEFLEATLPLGPNPALSESSKKETDLDEPEEVNPPQCANID